MMYVIKKSHISVIEWHDDCSLADYLKSALE